MSCTLCLWKCIKRMRMHLGQFGSLRWFCFTNHPSSSLLCTNWSSAAADPAKSRRRRRRPPPARPGIAIVDVYFLSSLSTVNRAGSNWYSPRRRCEAKHVPLSFFCFLFSPHSKMWVLCHRKGARGRISFVIIMHSC